MSENQLPAVPGGNVPLYLFRLGRNSHAQDYLGVHRTVRDGKPCTVCRVWAPHAHAVSLTGDFCNWDYAGCPLKKLDDAVWEGYTEEPLQPMSAYKLAITDQNGVTFLKADPYAFCMEQHDDPASLYYDISDYAWKDHAWYTYKSRNPHMEQPVNIYEVHAASWRRRADGSLLTYAELADQLIPYVREMGYTHVELMPMTAYAEEDSVGYNPTAFFAPAAQYGTPKAFMRFVDRLHQAGVGVILDWAPVQFDGEHSALYRFDGEPCFEYADPRKGEHKKRRGCVFDYGRNEVVSFLISSALFWIRTYHLDGLRMDSISAMLYLDYDRPDGAWLPNQYGGKENLEAIAFLRQLNEAVYSEIPDVMLIAEEATAWPMVTKPAMSDGLGFGYKWNLGWAQEMLRYMSLDPLFRKGSHSHLIYTLESAFSENHILPVAHGAFDGEKGSLYYSMPGSQEQKAAGVRGFAAFMMASPGKKLQFMGMELGQTEPWNPRGELQWTLLQYPGHQKMQSFFKKLNSFYMSRSELWEQDFTTDGFRWISAEDADQSVIAFRRLDKKGDELIVVCNFVPVQRTDYCIGVPCAGIYEELFNSEAAEFGGTGVTNGSDIRTVSEPLHGFEQQISLTLPENGVLFLRCRKKVQPKVKRSLFGRGRKRS